MERRHALLAKAESAHDLLLVEDDFECETNYLDEALPALRSSVGRRARRLCRKPMSRVLSSSSAPLASSSPRPTLSLRSCAACAPWCRAPSAAQQSAGHRTLHLARAITGYATMLQDRPRAARTAHCPARCAQFLPAQFDRLCPGAQGGTTYWVNGPPTISTPAIARAAEARGVLIEPVERYFVGGQPPCAYLSHGRDRHSRWSDRIRGGVAGGSRKRCANWSAAPWRGRRIRSQGHVPEGRSIARQRVLSGATFLFKTVYTAIPPSIDCADRAAGWSASAAMPTKTATRVAGGSKATAGSATGTSGPMASRPATIRASRATGWSGTIWTGGSWAMRSTSAQSRLLLEQVNAQSVCECQSPGPVGPRTGSIDCCVWPYDGCASRDSRCFVAMHAGRIRTGRERLTDRIVAPALW